jgi:AraC-like DNA-binding protein
VAISPDVLRDSRVTWCLLHHGVKGLAAMFAVSVSTLRRRCTAHGFCLAELVAARRAGLVVNLLQSPEMRLADVARETGFSNVTAFSRFVRREFGQTPGMLRAALNARATLGGDIQSAPRGRTSGLEVRQPAPGVRR